MKPRLSMEAALSIGEVVAAWHGGRITASQSRGLMESIAFDGVRASAIDPAELGGSLADRVLWFMRRRLDTRAVDVAVGLGVDVQAAAESLSRVCRRRQIERVGYGVYRAPKEPTR